MCVTGRKEENSVRKIREECGVFGIWSPVKQKLPMLTYYGLFALQHRGQEAAGIAVNEDGVFRYHRDLGLVHEVFHHQELDQLGEGQISVGHVRYSTSGVSNRSNAQPVVPQRQSGQFL